MDLTIGMDFLLLLAALPVIIILLIIYKKDRNKEPFKLLITLFLSGFVSCILVLIVSEIMSMFFPFMDSKIYSKSFTGVLLYSFIGVALVEETCKWVMVYLLGYNNREFDELYDGIVYAIFVSLGFAFIENILYVIKSASLYTALLRGISAVPSHACDAIFMGYYLSIAKHFQVKGKKKGEKKYIIYSLVFPTILHGVYDFCLMAGYQILVVSFIAFVIFLYTISIKKLLLLANHNRKIVFKNKFCGYCGKIVTTEFCSNCGHRQV